MERIAESVRRFVLEKVNAELPALEDEEASLPAVDERSVAFGSVDLSRYEAPVVVSVMPERTEAEEGFIDGYADKTRVAVTFIFQKAAYPVLVKRAFRYARAFRLAQWKSPELSGGIDGSEAAYAEVFYDAGSGGQSVTACEMGLDVRTREAFDEGGKTASGI